MKKNLLLLFFLWTPLLFAAPASQDRGPARAPAAMEFPAQMLSEVRLNVKSGAQKVEIESHNIQLNETIPDDPALGELISKARAEVAKVKK